MILRADEQRSHARAPWPNATFSIEAYPVDEPGYAQASDRDSFAAARAAGAVVMTRDSDVADLVYRLGPPPQILLIAIGNSRNSRLKEILSQTLPAALDLLRFGEPLVPIEEPGSRPHG